MKPKRIRPKRLVVECADEFHAEVLKHARRYDFKSAGAMIMFAIQKLLAEQKTAPSRNDAVE